MPFIARLRLLALAVVLLLCIPSAAPAFRTSGKASATSYAMQVAAQEPGAPTGASGFPDPTPISAQEYAARRGAVAGAMEDGLFLILGAPEPAADYLPFTQKANFRYLTGITEPGAALIIEKRGTRVEEIVFVLSRDPTRETWEGRRLGTEGARALTGIRSAAIDRLASELDAKLPAHGTLYTVAGEPPSPGSGRVLDADQLYMARLLDQHPHLSLKDLAPTLAELRAHKSPAEIDLIRSAVHITALAHREAMRATAPELNEFEVQALIEYTFRRHGADRPGFSSIVGSGPNSTTLHYNDNDRFMGADEVLLMDSGFQGLRQRSRSLPRQAGSSPPFPRKNPGPPPAPASARRPIRGFGSR